MPWMRWQKRTLKLNGVVTNFLTFLICHQIRLQHVLPSDLGYVIPQINNTLIMGENTVEVSHFCPKMAMYNFHSMQ
jgi:hypothetical protein